MTPSAVALPPWPLRSRSPMLGALPTAPGIARAHVKDALRGWGLADLIDVAQLVTSELVTNAVAASTDPATEKPLYICGRMMETCIDVFASSSGVRLEVWDQSPEVPKVTMADGNAESGRGLGMVVELTNHRLGWTRPDDRGWKCVWAEMGAQ